jgi:hypothetical protein
MASVKKYQRDFFFTCLSLFGADSYEMGFSSPIRDLRKIGRGKKKEK